MATNGEFEYIVVGLGGLGSAAAYWLARRSGRAVLGLEQFEPGHDKGASEDHSRIIRYTYHTPAYVELAHHAYAAWHALEEDAQETLVIRTGDVFMAPQGSPMPVTDYVESLTAQHVPFEQLDASEIMRRWPQFHLAQEVSAVFQPDGGMALASKGTAAHVRMAQQHGATVRFNTPVTALTARADGVEVATADATYRCRRLVLAADAWTNRLIAPLGRSFPLTLLQEQVAYYGSPHLDEFQPERFPVWVWSDNPCFYGVPVSGETHGVKAAQDVGGREVTLESRTFDPDPVMLERVSAFVRRTFPRMYGPVVHTKTCLYTLTPDRDFVIDTLPGYSAIVLALGAGHAFKFAGVIGRILSELALTGTTSYNVRPFAADRPILMQPDPPRNFLLTRETHAAEQGA